MEDSQFTESILIALGGDPKETANGFTSMTFCHGGDSRKLYSYFNEEAGKWMHVCYTSCGPIGDNLQLVRHVKEISLSEAQDFIETVTGQKAVVEADTLNPEFNKAARQSRQLVRYVDIMENPPELEEAKCRLNQFVKAEIKDWLREGIKQEVLERNEILWSPSSNGIIIPHRDKVGKLVGVRLRLLDSSEIRRRGKYIPFKECKHPLGKNLYGINFLKNTDKEVIVFEGEKSVLKYQSLIGDNAVAVCGSSASIYQLALLKSINSDFHIIFAFDKDWEDEEDIKYLRMQRKKKKILETFNDFKISFLESNNLNLHDSPIDEGTDVWFQIRKENNV